MKYLYINKSNDTFKGKSEKEMKESLSETDKVWLENFKKVSDEEKLKLYKSLSKNEMYKFHLFIMNDIVRIAQSL